MSIVIHRLQRPAMTALLSGVLMTSGCANVQRQMERVAKDWCMTIRASQVLPVYPLTEDLQPGDVFMVHASIHDQAREFRRRGFLALDQHATRLQIPDEYAAFYADAFLQGFGGTGPVVRPGMPGGAACGSGRPENATITGAPANPGGDPDTTRRDDDPAHGQDSTAADAAPSTSLGRHLLVPLPAAQFPTYTFVVSRSAGLRTALPIKGIPTGLRALRADNARGSVVLRDAFTYGLPGDVLLSHLHTWASDTDVQHELARLKQSVGHASVFLRVVNRVYLVGGVTVLLEARTGAGVSVEAGLAQPINLLTTGTDDLQRMLTNAELLSKIRAELGGSMKAPTVDERGTLRVGATAAFAEASERSVVLNEDFDRLQVIGYLGFDVEILEGGVLGPAVSTLYHLSSDGTRSLLAPAAGSTAALFQLSAISGALDSLENRSRSGDREAREAVRAAAQLAALAPKRFHWPIYEFVNADDLPLLRIEKHAGTAVDGTGARRLLDFLGLLDTSVSGLEEALDLLQRCESIRLEGTGDQMVTVGPGQGGQGQFDRVRRQLEKKHQAQVDLRARIASRMIISPGYRRLIHAAFQIME